MSKIARLASCAMLLAAIAAPASAAEQLVVNVDQTQILKTAERPGTIIIGSPGIVDASMQGGNLLIQGKGFGTTNIIILDRKGNEIGNYEVSVRVANSNTVALYKAGARYSYDCTPACEAAPQVGDQTTFVGDIIGSSSIRGAYMMRSTSTESQPTSGGGSNNSEN